MLEPITFDDDFGNALESLRELEASVDESVLQRRSSERARITAKVIVLPGNSSQRNQPGLDGVTGDVSLGGCLVVLAMPILSGDIFWLDFTQGKLAGLGGVLARCTRCRFISEGTFEVGFRFFNNVDVEYALSE